MEIIENGVSGFHVDPHCPNEVTSKLIDFFEHCQKDPSYWYKISDAGLRRISERYRIPGLVGDGFFLCKRIRCFDQSHIISMKPLTQKLYAI